jgi:KDO2-lipid IV(A) lauroyltransferase
VKVVLPEKYSFIKFIPMKFIEYLFIKLLHALFKIVPVSFNQRISRFLAFFIQKIVRYRTEVVRDNLTTSLPELSESAQKQIISEVYFNFACLWSELMQNHRLSADYINQHIRAHNFELLKEAQKAGKGLILLSGHLGNFEWLGSFLAQRLNGLYAVMKPVRNERVNDYVVNLRQQQGITLIFTKGALQQCLKALRNQHNIALVADQDAGHRGVFVEFFSRPAATATGAAQLYLKTGAPLFFCVAIRRNWGDFDFYFERIQDMSVTADRKQSVFNITQVHTRLLEKWITKYPGQYFWTHKRWKTNPGAEETKEYLHHLAMLKKTESR